ncbi:hypothetical protein P078_0017 [Lactococcus phage P078]|uniref:Uncharacterized protein n=2 Tax=Nevevirus TaxID=2843430 RepID=X4YUH1_9CAUD|nr:hypothetical protein GJ20_gp17 [Lactococcus phage P092]YP_009036842.1 hypothetical protein GJ21_gp17 [Lactococcus phage P078]AHV82980.1 hypothetical protein P078_0017 [Lactococcus phage P078]AHV83058.1 hypothetical protein P092_0017 [Lactococcus phage P092]
MGGLKITTSGNFDNSIAYLKRLQQDDGRKLLVQYGEMAMTNLSVNTPIDTGLTSRSYTMDIRKTSYGLEAVISNSNVTADGVPIPLIIHYGHGTGTGGYVPARPFIDTAIKPASDAFAASVERRLRN